MESDGTDFDQRMALRLRQLRGERGFSLDQLARASGISRATLSRLENAEVSPTASLLGKLCPVYGLTMSRLMLLVEDEFQAVLRRDSQFLWTDPTAGFRRRSVSPPAKALSGEVIECALDAGTVISYDVPPRPGLEHHLVMLAGALDLTVEGRTERLGPGDCIRYRLNGESRFATAGEKEARYLLFMV